MKGEDYDKIQRKKLTKKDRIRIYNQYDGHCAYCGIEIDIKDMQVDHVVPLRNAGKDELDNMICSCRSCNKYKHTMTIESLREELSKIPDRLIRDSTTFKIALRYGLVEIKYKEIEFFFE